MCIYQKEVEMRYGLICRIWGPWSRWHWRWSLVVSAPTVAMAVEVDLAVKTCQQLYSCSKQIFMLCRSSKQNFMLYHVSRVQKPGCMPLQLWMSAAMLKRLQKCCMLNMFMKTCWCLVSSGYFVLIVVITGQRSNASPTVS